MRPGAHRGDVGLLTGAEMEVLSFGKRAAKARGTNKRKDGVKRFLEAFSHTAQTKNKEVLC